MRIGAGATNTQVANHQLVRTRYPFLSQALLAGATTQLRNKATMGGNLLQRTRCPYFTDIGFPNCNKRVPGSGCAALGGFQRIHAILGQSENCIATHPSDMAVALTALDAVVQVQGARDSRSIPLTEFHRLPGDTPHLDTNLRHGELITSVDLPRLNWARSLISVACALDLQNGVIRGARLALGGVAHKPWRALEAESALQNQPATTQTFESAAQAAMTQARSYEGNAFKPELARRTIVRALTTLTA